MFCVRNVTRVVAAHEQLGDGVGRRDPQGHQAAPGADGGQDVVGARGAQEPHGLRRRLLDGLEQHIGGALGHAIGVLDEDDAPTARPGPPLGLTDELLNLVHGDEELVGGQAHDVGVGAGQDVAAGLAAPAARDLPRALEGGGEGAGGHRAAGAGRAGDEPGVGHGGGVSVGLLVGLGLGVGAGGLGSKPGDADYEIGRASCRERV